MKNRIASIVIAAGCACACGAQTTQPLPLAQHDVELNIHSGLVANTDAKPGVVFSTLIEDPGADWLRLRFDDVTLAGSDEQGTGAYLKITSAEDGAVQYLDTESLAQWRYTSAYFNGDAVLVELYAYPGTGASELNISSAIAGDPPAIDESICGPTDDRTLSNDPRTARALPIGCTAWLIDDCEHCFLTAGHCNGGGNNDINVLQFNVPLSDNSCTFGGINHPGPEDQYAVDPASQQSNGGQGVGNDWGYLGAFPNSNTGLLPYQAQGSWYTLDNTTPTANTARVTGYGSVSSSLAPCTWYAVQKTHAGPFFSLSGNALAYGMDTTGGNSGSPVTDEATGNAIGIHTHGGCSTSGGNNSGTWVNHSGLQAALANPQGVCVPQGPIFSFPNGLPDIIAPVGITLPVTIDPNGTAIPDPATAILTYDDGMGAVTTAMTHLGGNSYEADLLGGACFASVTYSFGVDDTLGESYTAPVGGPVSATVADSFNAVVDLDMETDPGWTVGGSSIITGQWERVIPGDWGRADPSADGDGSGMCWVTDNGNQADVDGGPVILTTATYDASGLTDPEVSYYIWHDTSDLNSADTLTVEISNNGGASWTQLEQIATTTNGWEQHSFAIADFVSPTNAMVLRFSSVDNPNNSVTESAVDGFRIGSFVCNDAVCLPDVNHDGQVTPADFTAWVAAFNAGDPECDQNLDGQCTASDFTAWVANFNAGCN
ncbi:MAG TPA: hypothetical protein ENJ00_02865 [Phycisphaerales bacterium]|nr:hypothetical protein [Phycisphaerales bacterium]